MKSKVVALLQTLPEADSATHDDGQECQAELVDQTCVEALSHEVATVEVHVLAAALSGYAAHDESLLHMAAALAAGFETLGIRGDALRERLLRMLVYDACTTPDEPEAWVVEWVATLPEFQRRGLVRKLLDAVLERGRERGHPVAQLAILIGNTSAQRAYESVGFELTYEKRTPEFEAAIGAPGMARMVLRY